jgi:hypothetical protein
MALNSDHHSIYLEMPFEAQLMPELGDLPFWARTVHEVLFQVNPARIVEMSKAGTLQTYLHNQQEKLSDEARALEKAWRKANPISDSVSHLDRAAWLNHAKQSAREQLIDELSKSLSALSLESGATAQ